MNTQELTEYLVARFKKYECVLDLADATGLSMCECLKYVTPYFDMEKRYSVLTRAVRRLKMDGMTYASLQVLFEMSYQQIRGLIRIRKPYLIKTRKLWVIRKHKADLASTELEMLISQD